jgi:hypothetical protein
VTYGLSHLPSSSGRSQKSLRAPSSLGCMHLRKTWVRDILYWPHHQHLSDTCSSRFFLTRLRYGAHSQCPVRICATVLASRFEARSRKDFFGAGGVIVSLPLSVSESFAIVKCCEIRSLSHEIDVRPCRLSEAASPAS